MKEEIVLNKIYSDMDGYYGTTIIPARVKKPKDKPLIENAVGKLTTYIISHISFQKCYYSVPYKYIGKEVDLKIFSDRFEVYSQSTLIYIHRILVNRMGVYDTDISHMPPNSASYGEWNNMRFLNWAKAKGPYTYQVIHLLFKDSKAEQRHYNAPMHTQTGRFLFRPKIRKLMPTCPVAF